MDELRVKRVKLKDFKIRESVGTRSIELTHFQSEVKMARIKIDGLKDKVV
jgi:hypothetical protein